MQRNPFFQTNQCGQKYRDLYLVDVALRGGVDELVKLRHEDAVGGDAHLLGAATERRQTLTRLGRPAHDDLQTGRQVVR